MRLLELEISELRGIRHLVVVPNGRNAVILGPNGTGKSAIVDALDFLLTGSISRIQGEGTRGLSLAKHGKNLEGGVESSWVRGKFLLRNSGSTVELLRHLGNPSDLMSDRANEAEVGEAVTLAQQGQHILTRRVLLQFILSEGKPRAELIQKLLNADDLESVRVALVKCQSILDRDLEVAEASLKSTLADLAAAAGLPEFSLPEFVDAVRKFRSTLGGTTVGETLPDDLKEGLSPPASLGPFPASARALDAGSIRSLRGLLDGTAQAVATEQEAALRQKLAELRASTATLKSLRVESLLRAGLELIDDEPVCPLCETPWDIDRLKQHIQHRLDLAREAKEIRDSIEKASSPLLSRAERALADLRLLCEAAVKEPRTSSQLELESWKDRLSRLRSLLESPIERYPNPDWDPTLVARLGAPPDFEELLSSLEVKIVRLAATMPPELVAWDSLTRLTEFWKKRASGVAVVEQTRAASALSTTVRARFESTRVSKLAALYEEIATRFAGLYAELHPEEAETFRASLTQEKAAALLQVGFLGVTDVPPAGLHSEGHQDSMGLCMYLALSERIARDKLGFSVLDDVVMSIDASHRRKVAELISGLSKDRQFLITTHDQVWAHQLRTLGVVTSSDITIIRGWSLSGGPVTQIEPDFWDEIDSEVKAGRMSVAAGILRRNLEAFFAEACAALEGKVVYRRETQWDLGDYLPAAYSRWKDLVEEGRRGAARRGDTALMAKLATLSSDGAKSLKGAQVEQWGVNATLHYNNWADLTPADFLPIVSSLRELYSTLRCANCSSVLSLARVGTTKNSVACRCGKVFWPLS